MSVFNGLVHEREGDRVSGGRSLRDFEVLIIFIVTRSPSVACGASTNTAHPPKAVRVKVLLNSQPSAPQVVRQA